MTSVLDALDLDRFPLQDLESAAGKALVARCRQDLAERGLTNLEGLIRPPATYFFNNNSHCFKQISIIRCRDILHLLIMCFRNYKRVTFCKRK